MAESTSFGEIHLDVEAGRARRRSKPRPETPFRIAVIGDFSGRANQEEGGGGRSAAVKPILIDRDNFDEVMTRLSPQLSLSPAGGGPAVRLRFQELDDFDPDRIYEQAPLFRTLRETRRRLADASEFQSAATELGLMPAAGESRRESQPPAAGPAESPDPRALSSGSLLEDALQATAERTESAAESSPGAAGRRGVGREDDLSAFLRRVVAPHAVADPHPKQAEVLARWDEETTNQLRAVMHHPAFQALEANWRGLFWLVRSLETGTELKIYLLDCSQRELAEDLDTGRDLRESRLAKALADPGGDWADDPGWGMLAGLYRFGATAEDALALAQLAVVAAYLDAPFVAEAAPAVFGCPDLAAAPDPSDWKQSASSEVAESWRVLRELPPARYLALAAPRFLLRLPYGEETVPTETFRFEEAPVEGSAGPSHSDFLWGNPALACACVLGRNFTRDGWEMRPGAMRELDGVPMHLYKQGGEARQLPCAEAWLGERAAEKMLEHGILPLLSIKNRGAVVFFDIRSLAEGDQDLAGRWA